MNTNPASSSSIFPDGIQQDLQVHFAMQLCDSTSFQGQPRVCGDDRTALSQRSVLSFVQSVDQCAQQRPRASFKVMLFADQISKELRDFCGAVMRQYWSTNLTIDFCDIAPATGIGDSILACYQWMQDHGTQVVGQFQDDYIFQPQAITDSLDVLMQMQIQGSTDALITPHHFSAFWTELYQNQSTPRCVVVGRHDYWIQIYDIACTFITTHRQFQQHWDLYNMFIELCKIFQYRGEYHGLENQSLNHIMTRRSVLALAPMRTLSHHVQSERELDPHQDWRELWNSIDIAKIQL